MTERVCVSKSQACDAHWRNCIGKGKWTRTDSITHSLIHTETMEKPWTIDRDNINKTIGASELAS